MRGCRPLTDAEISRVTHAFEGRYARRNRAFFILGVKTGLRCHELLGLKLGDVWRGGRVLDRVYVRRAITKGQRTGFALPLHPLAASTLRSYIKKDCRSRLAGAPLFCSAKSGLDGDLRPLDRSSAWRILKGVFRRAGAEGNTGCHSMRKTFCKKVYHALGNDLVATQVAMHHRAITSTLRYLSFDSGRVEAAILAA